MTIDKVALRERGKGIQRVFTKEVLPLVLGDGKSCNDFSEITVDVSVIEKLLSSKLVVQALRMYRAEVAHEAGHTYITKPNSELWRKWSTDTVIDYNTCIAYGRNPEYYKQEVKNEVKHLIANIIEDRKIDYAVSKRYKTYDIANRTLNAFVWSQQLAPRKNAKTLFRNALISGCLFGKVKHWDKLTQEGQKAIYQAYQIIKGIELVNDNNVVLEKASLIYDTVSPFFDDPDLIRRDGNVPCGTDDFKGELDKIPHDGFDTVDLPETPQKADDLTPDGVPDLGKRGIHKFADGNMKGVILKNTKDSDKFAKDFLKGMEKFDVGNDVSHGEIKEIKVLFGIDINEEDRKKLEHARNKIIQQHYGKYKIKVPESDYDKYDSYRDDVVIEQINKLKRILLEEQRLKKKVRTTESGGLLSPTWMSDYIQRDDKLFIERKKSVRNVAWAVLTDVSSSVCEKDAIQSFIVLSDVGKTLCGDDKLLLSAFSDTYIPIKDLNEKTDMIVKGRIGNCYHCGCTNLCCSIEKIAYRLKSTTADKKVLIIVSDGDGNHCEKALHYEEHLKEVVHNAKREGIIVVHVLLMYGCPIGDVLVAPITNLNELADKFIELYKKIAWVR